MSVVQKSAAKPREGCQIVGQALRLGCRVVMLVAAGVPADAMSVEPGKASGEASHAGVGQEGASSGSGNAVERSFERELGRVESGPASRETCRAMEAAILSDRRRWERIAPSPSSAYEPLGSHGGVPPDGTNGGAYRSYVQRCP